MSSTETAFAIRWIARRVIDNVVSLEDFGADQWENFPEIGENDWNDVVAEVRSIVISENPSDSIFQRAYEHLAARADK